MRFHSNLIKFVAVDEPSSALDAEAELRLFQRLVKAREGKTMVSVTHRFGGLVKEANLVVCMKDGTIADIGTHEELMKNTASTPSCIIFRLMRSRMAGAWVKVLRVHRLWVHQETWGKETNTNSTLSMRDMDTVEFDFD
ncbi:hypothetical protein BJ165DRAFT_1509702 [Panaeolus papilionaceus]|nr:hypothetical protein BJ165DRAFT_1509702 [Panaeolus papilionaceus]